MWRLCKVLSLNRKNNMTVKVLSRASGHKQVKLHALLLNFINFINSLEEREKRRRKRPQRGAESSGSVTHTDANYLPITDISTLCLNGRNVTDHGSWIMYVHTCIGLLKESSIHTVLGTLASSPGSPIFSKHSTECFKGAIKCLLPCVHAQEVK